MEIRPLRYDADASGCLALFDSCFPDPEVDAARREEFSQFLQSADASRYFVAEHDGAIVGGGGFTVDVERQSAQLEWALIRRDLQRQGLGRFLLLYRLKEIGKIPGVVFVEAQVPAHLSGFYAKNGLKTVGAGARPGWSAQRMKLQVCAAS